MASMLCIRAMQSIMRRCCESIISKTVQTFTSTVTSSCNSYMSVLILSLICFVSFVIALFRIACITSSLNFCLMGYSAFCTTSTMCTSATLTSINLCFLSTLVSAKIGQ